jgi:hypothetical protein
MITIYFPQRWTVQRQWDWITKRYGIVFYYQMFGSEWNIWLTNKDYDNDKQIK